MPVFMNDEPSKEEEGGWRFGWDASYDLQGDALTYDFALAKAPTFKGEEVVLEKTGLKEVEYVVKEPLPSGTYYMRVVIRDAKDPKAHWQMAFGSYEVPNSETLYRGVVQVKIP